MYYIHIEVELFFLMCTNKYISLSVNTYGGERELSFFFFFVGLFGCVDRVVESGLVYLRKNKINKLNFLGTYVSDFSDFLFIICILEYNKLFDSDFFFSFFFLLFCYYGIKSCNPSSYFGIGIVHQT